MQMFEEHAQSLYAITPFELSSVSVELRIGVPTSDHSLRGSMQQWGLHGALNGGIGQWMSGSNICGAMSVLLIGVGIISYDILCIN